MFYHFKQTKMCFWNDGFLRSAKLQQTDSKPFNTFLFPTFCFLSSLSIYLILMTQRFYQILKDIFFHVFCLYSVNFTK